jgi:predicted ATPase
MELKTARALAQQCLELARRIQDPALLLEANRMVGETAFHRGMLGEAREYLERSRTLYDPRQHRAHAALYGQDPGVALLAHGSLTLWHLGYPDQALKWSQEALAQAQDASHPFSMVFALEYASILHQLRGEGEAALERAEAAIALSGEQRFGMWLAMAGILRAWALVERGEAAAGIAGIRQGLADYRDWGSELFTPYFLTLLARALRRVGESEAALDALDEALQTGERTEGRVWEAECYRVKGELLQEAPAEAVSGRDRGDAEASLRQAVAVARQHGARSLELRAAMTLCTTWSRQGKKADARQLLAEPYRWFTEGFGTADLRQAASLLESVSA